jgi:hypothetical protein
MSPKDIRRFCIPCSQETGKLVDLICPARETQKKKTQERAARKAKEAREKENQKYFLSDGTDTRPIWKKVRGLKTWAREGTRYGTVARRASIPTRPIQELGISPADEWALQAIVSLANDVISFFPGRARTDGNFQSLIIAAACEFFSLDLDTVRALRDLTHRLKHGGTSGITPTWGPAIRQAILAREAGGKE